MDPDQGGSHGHGKRKVLAKKAAPKRAEERAHTSLTHKLMRDCRRRMKLKDLGET
jgi:hypothetical protein